MVFILSRDFEVHQNFVVLVSIVYNNNINNMAYFDVFRLLCHIKGHSALTPGGTMGKMAISYIQGQRHLLDDSLLEQSPCASSQSSLHGSGI